FDSQLWYRRRRLSRGLTRGAPPVPHRRRPAREARPRVRPAAWRQVRVAARIAAPQLAGSTLHGARPTRASRVCAQVMLGAEPGFANIGKARVSACIFSIRRTRGAILMGL